VNIAPQCVGMPANFANRLLNAAANIAQNGFTVHHQSAIANLQRRLEGALQIFSGVMNICRSPSKHRCKFAAAF